MFDIFSWQHIAILLAVALVVVGPKDLPPLMHKAGKWAAKARRMAGDVRRSFDDMARQSEMDELRKEIAGLKKNNPVAGMASSVAGINSDVSRELGMAGAAVASSKAPAASPGAGLDPGAATQHSQ